MPHGKRMTTAVGLLMALVLAAPIHGVETNGAQDEQAIRALVARIDAAWRDPDGSTIMAEVISDKAVIPMSRPGTPALARLMGKAEFMEAFKNGRAKGPTQHIHETLNITIEGPFAYEVWRSVDKFQDGTVRHNEFMNIYAKDESGWKLIFAAPTASLKKSLAAMNEIAGAHKNADK